MAVHVLNALFKPWKMSHTSDLTACTSGMHKWFIQVCGFNWIAFCFCCSSNLQPQGEACHSEVAQLHEVEKHQGATICWAPWTKEKKSRQEPVGMTERATLLTPPSKTPRKIEMMEKDAKKHSTTWNTSCPGEDKHVITNTRTLQIYLLYSNCRGFSFSPKSFLHGLRGFSAGSFSKYLILLIRLWGIMSAQQKRTQKQRKQRPEVLLAALGVKVFSVWPWGCASSGALELLSKETSMISIVKLHNCKPC